MTADYLFSFGLLSLALGFVLGLRFAGWQIELMLAAMQRDYVLHDTVMRMVNDVRRKCEGWEAVTSLRVVAHARWIGSVTIETIKTQDPAE